MGGAVAWVFCGGSVGLGADGAGGIYRGLWAAVLWGRTDHGGVVGSCGREGDPMGQVRSMGGNGVGWSYGDSLGPCRGTVVFYGAGGAVRMLWCPMGWGGGL